MAEAKNQTAAQEAASAVNVKVSQSELDNARKEGALEGAKEAGKNAYIYSIDNGLGAETSARQFTGMHEIMQYAYLLGLGVEAFEAAVKEDAEPAIPEEKAAGLLELERSGQNRTPYVKALMARLKVKSPYEVTQAGPGYTNDVSATTVAI